MPLVAVAGQLGHASTNFTASTYQFASDKLLDQVAEALDRAFATRS